MNHQSYTMNRQSSTICQQSAINHQPSTINHQSSTINSNPCTVPERRLASLYPFVAASAGLMVLWVFGPFPGSWLTGVSQPQVLGGRGRSMGVRT